MVTPLKTAVTYTAEEFMALPLDPGKRYDLVRGEIKEMSHPGGEHMLVVNRLSRALWQWLFSLAGSFPGEIFTPGGFSLAVDPDKDTVRSPDLTFIGAANLSKLDKGSVKFPPDLAVEVYWPNDRPGELLEKLQDYQQTGWNIVWVIYPPSATPKKKAGTVALYRLQEESGIEPAQTLDQTDTLIGEEVLEGFRLPVANLFDYEGEA